MHKVKAKPGEHFATLANGDVIHLFGHALILHFASPRDVLSTSPFNGGQRNDLDAVFNFDGSLGTGVAPDEMYADSFPEHMRIVAKRLGLDPHKSAGLLTIAQMENASIQTECFDGVSVAAIVTAGVKHNAGRAGDPASWFECAGEMRPVAAGTINVMLAIDAAMPPDALARTLITATEAKSAALQDLVVRSLETNRIATGTGTDGNIVIANPGSSVYLEYAGKHSKLGEMIGQTVYRAVKEALAGQNAITPATLRNVWERLACFGIDPVALTQGRETPDAERLERIAKRGDVVAMTAALVHLIDECEAGLIDMRDLGNAASALASSFAATLHIQKDWDTQTDPQCIIRNWVNLLLCAANENGSVANKQP